MASSRHANSSDAFDTARFTIRKHEEEIIEATSTVSLSTLLAMLEDRVAALSRTLSNAYYSYSGVFVHLNHGAPLVDQVFLRLQVIGREIGAGRIGRDDDVMNHPIDN